MHLVPGTERTAEVEALAAALAREGGGRVGLSGVLSDLDRAADVVRVPAPAATWGFRWDLEDSRSGRWWPQGITSSADHDPSEEYDGRPVVMASWYSKDVEGLHMGSRISVVDLADERRPRYGHVLLVDASTREDGTVDVRPLKVHAGGIVWHGDHLHVAGTARGISTFRLDDVMRVGGAGDPRRLGAGTGSFGYRFVLPVRFAYDAFADEGHERMRYSFLSLDRGGEEPRLLAGEYGRGRRGKRLVDFGIDPVTSLPRVSEEGRVVPLTLSAQGLDGMQGAVTVDDSWYVTTSAGPFLRGTMYVGRPGEFRRRPWILPAGVEDVAYWPSRDELWSLTEYPRRRYVFAMSRAGVA